MTAKTFEEWWKARINELGPNEGDPYVIEEAFKAGDKAGKIRGRAAGIEEAARSFYYQSNYPGDYVIKTIRALNKEGE